jgi:hypothetical protein
MTKYLIGMAGALGGMLVGGWLMLAPFALAYQLSGAGWGDPTYTDFWSGLAILVISLIGLIAYVLGLVRELRRRGIIEERREETPQVQQAQVAGTPVAPTGGETPTGSGDNIEQILLPLVTAMLKDMQEDQRRREENGETSQSIATPKWRLVDPERRAQQ